MGSKKTVTLKVKCANCSASLPGPYGMPGVSLARFDNKTLLCSECGTAEAMGHHIGAVKVSAWFNSKVDSHMIYSHAEIARMFLQETGQLADWPVDAMQRRGLGGSVCYGWIMARHMARKLVNHESHMMGRGFEFRDCVAALEKGGF